MNGEGFEAKVAQGDKVKAGDVLGTFDSNKIAAMLVLMIQQWLSLQTQLTTLQ